MALLPGLTLRSDLGFYDHVSERIGDGAAMKVRVVLEKVRIMNSRHPALEEVELVFFDVRVRTDNHGGVEQRRRLPEGKSYRPITGWSFGIEEPVFEAEVEDHLSVRIDMVEGDGSVSDEPIATYSREFSSDPTSWLADYAPEDASGPEHLDYWQVFYRIEQAE